MKKKYQNEVQENDNLLQNRFTAYVREALLNNQITYTRKQSKLHGKECTDSFLKTCGEDTAADIVFETTYADELDVIENLTLLSALHSISDKDMTIIKLHVIYEYSYKEIACIMGMTLTAVRSRYSRAIQRIRKRMEDSK